MEWGSLFHAVTWGPRVTSSNHHLTHNQLPQKGKFSGKCPLINLMPPPGRDTQHFLVIHWSHIPKGKLENLVLLCVWNPSQKYLANSTFSVVGKRESLFLRQSCPVTFLAGQLACSLVMVITTHWHTCVSLLSETGSFSRNRSRWSGEHLRIVTMFLHWNTKSWPCSAGPSHIHSFTPPQTPYYSDSWGSPLPQSPCIFLFPMVVLYFPSLLLDTHPTLSRSQISAVIWSDKLFKVSLYKHGHEPSPS